MRDSGADSPTGEFPGSADRDKRARQSDAAASGAALPPPFFPSGGVGGFEPPEVITDQVAALASRAVELPSITEFLYDEPALPEPEPEPAAFAAEPSTPARQPTPAEATPAWPTPARQTPARGFVPPLPGFSPARGTPASAFPEYGYGAPENLPAPAQATDRRTPAQPGAAAGDAPIARPGDSWGTGEWQRYDWQSASALAPEERARAAQAWADLDWEPETKGRVRQRNEVIATALEGIARRVRSGDLLVHGHPEMTEEAAAAAALAALLARRT